MKEFINQNARRPEDRILQDYDDKIKYLANLNHKREQCHQSDYSRWREFFLKQIASENIEQMRKKLENSGDPNEGDCL
jgi:hypothetical protein